MIVRGTGRTLVKSVLAALTVSFTHYRPLVKSGYQTIIFFFLNQNICCGYSKIPSQSDGSFEHTKHVKTDG